MNCHDAREQLSAYHDGELDETLALEVSSHLSICEACRGECRCYESLSALSADAMCGGDPPPAWASVLERLQTQPAVTTPSLTFTPRRFAAASALAIAAAVLIVVGIRLSDAPVDRGGTSHQLASAGAVDLGSVIQRFASGSDAAVDLLARQSGAREVAATASASHIVLASLPGARPISTRVLQFPHCTCAPGECVCDAGGCGCVASVYQRDDRSEFLVLEQCKSHPVSFGLLPRQEVEKGGQAVQEFHSDDLIAVSWETDRRRYTAIGLKGDAEADQVITAAAGQLAGQL